MDIYVYYKVPSRHAEILLQKIMALQALLSSVWQVQTSLKCRAESGQTADSVQTWMEIYSAVPNGFSGALDSAVKAGHLESLIEGERHCEFFRDIAECV